MPDHLELAHKLVDASIEARRLSLHNPRAIYATKQRRAKLKLSESLNVALLDVSRPAVESIISSLCTELPRKVDASYETKRNETLIYFMIYSSDAFIRQDWENQFWRHHFTSNMRLEIDGNISRGFASFREKGDLELERHPRVGIDISDVCISEMNSRNTCLVMMVIKFCNLQDGLTRGGVVASTWRSTVMGWKCSEWAYATGSDGELSGF